MSFDTLEQHKRTFIAIKNAKVSTGMKLFPTDGVVIGHRDPVASHIATLDGWRAIAILLVLTHHLGTAFFDSDRYWTSSPTRFGVIGVPIFFGLSGFLITSLLLREMRSSGQISFKHFYLRRCFRILPALFLFLFATRALGLMVSPLEFVSSLFFFRNYLSPGLGGVCTFHLWSLSVEEHFYLLWPLTLVLLYRGRKLLSRTVALALIFGIWGSVDFHFQLLHRIAPMLDTPMRTDLRLGTIIWGCAAGVIFENGRMREAVARQFLLPLFGLAAAALICSQVIALPMAAIWGSALIPSLILATATHPCWAVSRFLETGWFRWIGRISYSLYLWQQLWLVPRWETHPLGWTQGPPFNIVLSFGCAIASYYLVEQPIIRLGRRLSRRVHGRNALALDAATVIPEPV